MPEARPDPVATDRAAAVEESRTGDIAAINHPAMEASGPLQGKPTSGPRALIYRPCRSAMSSGGKAALQSWVLEFERQSACIPDPLMGWPSSRDTLSQVQLKFRSREAAVAYARRNGIAATVVESHRPRLIIRSYASNFIGNGSPGT